MHLHSQESVHCADSFPVSNKAGAPTALVQVSSTLAWEMKPGATPGLKVKIEAVTTGPVKTLSLGFEGKAVWRALESINRAWDLTWLVTTLRRHAAWEE